MAWWKNRRGEWFLPIQGVILVLIAIGPFLLTDWPDLPNGFNWVFRGIGLILGAVGTVMIGTGLLTLGRDLSALPHPKDNAPLIQTGIYGMVRHPIYSGLIIGSAGWGLLFTSLLTLLFTVGALAFFDIKSRREERWLERKFPQYAAYRSRVRKLIPFVY